MIFPDKSLATRFEHHLAQDMYEYVQVFQALFPDVKADSIAIGNGVALFLGFSFLNTSAGIGIGQPISSKDIDQLEAFFRDRDIPAQIELCAFADETLITELNQRGYQFGQFSTAYTHNLQNIPTNQSDIVVKPIEDSQKDTWARTVNDIDEDDTTTDIRLAQAVTHRANTTCFLATLDGVPVGASALSLRDDTAICYFTSTRQQYRNRGVQTAMLQVRLAYAKSQGCEMVLATSNPGVQSMRNLMRVGFQVAYTRFKMLKDVWE